MRTCYVARAVFTLAGAALFCALTPAAQAATPIWGAVDPVILGTCTTAVHDRFVINGGDGYLYRTWHPQVVPVNPSNPSVTCRFAHEHGDNPASQTNTEIKAGPIRFGYIGRRHPMPPAEPYGHDEPHEGFKVFVANKGVRNAEWRTNLHDTRLVFHMGTGGPKRFNMSMHSMEYRVITNDGRKMFVQAMADTGGVGNICANPRQGKTVMVLGSSCKVNSLYEIWEEKVTIRSNGAVVARAVASTAVFDPITAYDPANPTRLLYIWDPAMNIGLNWPKADRTQARGCDRESYHGPTAWYNQLGRDIYYTDAMGNEVVYGPLALKQEISRVGYKNFVATSDGMSQFKLRKNYCAAGLGFKN
jgi:hypothetical protein